MNKYGPYKYHRRSIRLVGWDYRSPSYYFVTICTFERQNLFNSPNFPARWAGDRDNLDALLAKMTYHS
jgi:hypothetical protein